MTKRLGAIGTSLVAMGLCLGCGHRAERRDLERASSRLGSAVKRGDERGVRQGVVPGARARLDTQTLLAESTRRSWAKALSDPDEVRPEAVILLAPDYPVRAVWTPEGWRLLDNPVELYAQDTPRNALRTLVRASRAQRWDVLLGLAPKRYRMGLSEAELAKAWTEGEHAKALGAARDALADHLADPIISDAHEAVLELAQGHVVRLEREGERWVVVDFLPET